MTTGSPDSIPAVLVKNCAYISVPLTTIVNLILKTCTFSSRRKFPKAISVFKKGSQSDIMNYRTITINCNFSKVSEIGLKNIFLIIMFQLSTVLFVENLI